jgi:hypothetical protein
MNLAQKTIAVLGLILIGAALVGLVVRRRYTYWWFFDLYLLAIFIGTAVPHVTPQWYTPAFYQAKEMVYTPLRFAMALEIGLRIFRSFPGALATARRLVLLVLIGTLVAILLAPYEGYETFVGDLLPRIVNGTVWLFSGLAALILWYRLPLKPFYKRVVLSYVPYLFISTVVMTLLAKRGWEKGANIQYLNQLAYVALLAYWNYAIWRRDPAPAAPAPDPRLQGIA